MVKNLSHSKADIRSVLYHFIAFHILYIKNAENHCAM